MLRRLELLLFVLLCCTVAPLAAQARQSPAPAAPVSTSKAVAGPTIPKDFARYEPIVAREEAAAAAAAADRTVITISTLGLVLLVALLIILIA